MAKPFPTTSGSRSDTVGYSDHTPKRGLTRRSSNVALDGIFPRAAPLNATPSGRSAGIGTSMDKSEALQVVAEWLSQFRAESYGSLVGRISQPPVTAEISRHGTIYQLELECFWDSEPGGNVRVLASIDDGGVRAFFPLTDGFIRSSAGQFVGE